MGQPTTAVLDIDKIHVEEGFNPRKGFDDSKLRELAESIRRDGITTALTVRPNGGSGYVLVAGERRLLAAKEAGLKQVPVLIRDKDGAFAAAFAENEFRHDLNPVEVAEALHRLRSEEQLGTQKKLAKRVGKSPAYVAARLRLLNLPEPVQALIAAGTVPIEAEPNLRVVAKASPRAAECACELVAMGEFSGRNLIDAIDDILFAVAEQEFSDPPTLLHPHQIRLSEVIENEAHRDKLSERYKALFPWLKSVDPAIALSQQEIDAARAAGCLLEIEAHHPEWSSTAMFITDKTLAGVLAETWITREEKEVKKQRKRAEKRATASEKQVDPEIEKQRQERERVREQARRHNDEVGRLLINSRRRGNGKKDNLRRAKAVAIVAVEKRWGALSAAGLRLVLPQLRASSDEGEGAKSQNSGPAYVTLEQANAYLREKFEAATSESEVMRLLVDAMVACRLADRQAEQIPGTDFWHPSEDERIDELLRPEIEAATPVKSDEGK